MILIRISLFKISILVCLRVLQINKNYKQMIMNI